MKTSEYLDLPFIHSFNKYLLNSYMCPMCSRCKESDEPILMGLPFKGNGAPNPCKNTVVLL